MKKQTKNTNDNEWMHAREIKRLAKYEMIYREKYPNLADKADLKTHHIGRLKQPSERVMKSTPHNTANAPG